MKIDYSEDQKENREQECKEAMKAATERYNVYQTMLTMQSSVLVANISTLGK